MLDDVGRMDGYLLLADISGYTKFLTGTELEHSHAIVTELTKLIRARLCRRCASSSSRVTPCCVSQVSTRFPMGNSSSNSLSPATSITPAVFWT